MKKKHYEQNKESIIKKGQEYYKNNVEKKKEYDRIYREKNIVKKRETDRLYREKNREPFYKRKKNTEKGRNWKNYNL